MMYLLLSILLSSSLFVCFKWFGIRQVNLLPAISGNYMACIGTALWFEGPPGPDAYTPGFLAACALMGLMFFAVFYAMGYASSAIGVGISSAAAKLSLIIPVLFGALALNEPLGLSKIVSLCLVLPAIYLMSRRPGEQTEARQLWLPLLIFIGSGAIDTGLNLLQKYAGNGSSAGIIVAVFSTALLCSLLFIRFQNIPLKSDLRSMAYGLMLGVPNYFSVYVMLKALGSGALSSGQFYLINNTGVMLLSFVAAAVLFSETINLMKLSGIALAGISIYLILLG